MISYYFQKRKNYFMCFFLIVLECLYGNIWTARGFCSYELQDSRSCVSPPCFALFNIVKNARDNALKTFGADQRSRRVTVNGLEP